MSLLSIRARARKQVERLYEDTCTIYDHPAVEHDDGSTGYEVRAIHVNVPCRISFSSSPVVVDEETPRKTQTIKLFLAPELSIPAGCRISVKREGRVTDYSRSGDPTVYKTHQEVVLESWEGWA